jgi:2-polyprenyl-3-methyl-5-hydroxy-6-metoxy-1,4-benzoquinol methylase
MISHEEFLKTELNMGISADNPEFINLANVTVGQLTIDYTSVLDYGAGTGVYADAFQRAGKMIKVYELWQPHKDYISEKFPNLEIVAKPCTTDLLVWIEVAEHMTDKEIDSLFKKIKPKHILFSSTPNKTQWDAEWGHINIKDHQGWIDTLSKYRYTLQQDLSYPTPWSKLFVCGS